MGMYYTAWWPQWIMCVLRAQSYPTLCDSMEYSPPDRLPCSWNFPGKNIGVGCHFLPGDLPNPDVNLHTAWWPQWIMCVLRARSCPTLCDSMEHSPPDRLLCSWNFPGKNTGVGCHFLPGNLPNPDVNLHLLRLCIGRQILYQCATILIAYLKAAKRVNLKSVHHKEKNFFN